MLLENKNAIIYGAAGAIGSAVSRRFAREGAKLFLAGRTLKKLDDLANQIRSEGGYVETARVDALNEAEVNKHADEIVRKSGRIDISFNLVSIDHIHGTPLIDLNLEDYSIPVTKFVETNFLTAKASARHMIEKKTGVILMVTASPARKAIPLVGAFGVICAAIEAFARTLAAEIGPHGIRVNCLLSSGSPEAPGVQEAMSFHAKKAGQSLEEFQNQMKKDAMLRRLTSLEEVANTAVLISSSRASAITGTVINLSCGLIPD